MPFFHPELGGSFSSVSIVNLDQVNVGWGTCSCIAFELTFPHIVKFTHRQKMKFSMQDFFSKCNQIRSFLRIWSHLLKKAFMENFIFSAVTELHTSKGVLRTLSNIYYGAFFEKSELFKPWTIFPEKLKRSFI